MGDITPFVFLPKRLISIERLSRSARMSSASSADSSTHLRTPRSLPVQMSCISGGIGIIVTLMKVAFWYLLSVVAGLISILGAAGAATCVNWSGAWYNFTSGHYSQFYFHQEQSIGFWTGLFFFSFAFCLFSTWRLFKVGGAVTKDDWFRIGTITAILIAPVILVVALRWKVD